MQRPSGESPSVFVLGFRPGCFERHTASVRFYVPAWIHDIGRCDDVRIRFNHGVHIMNGRSDTERSDDAEDIPRLGAVDAEPYFERLS